MTTMNEMYGDSSDHTVCLKCGFCHTCKDCKCKNPVLAYPEEKKVKVTTRKLKHTINQHDKHEKCVKCGKKYWTPTSAQRCCQ